MTGIDSELVGLDNFVLRMQNLPRAVDDSLVGTMESETALLQQAVVARMRALFKTSAKMEASLSREVTSGAGGVVGTVTAAGLPYLRIQEFGGTVQIPDIFPVNASVLAFLAPASFGFSGSSGQSGMIFTMHTKAHPVTLPERSYMRSALAQRRAAIIDAFRARAMGTAAVA